MQVLFNSIYNKFKGSTGADSPFVLLGGRLYFTEAPQESVYPYGVYSLISDVPSWIFGTSESTMENYLIQFNVFDDNSSSTDVNTASKALTDLYDWCDDLNTSGYSNIYMKREMSNLTREAESGVWNFFVQYRVETQVK